MENTNIGCRELTLRKTSRYLKKHDNYVIITHASPDGDTLGAAYALYYGLKEIGKVAEVICPDLIPKKYDYFVHETDHVQKDIATIIAVDVADAKLLGSLEELFGDKVELNIDHHISNTRFSKNLCLDSQASATCEIIFELLNIMKVNINSLTARALYTGIATDTGCFKFSNVTDKTHAIVSHLYEYEIGAAEINRIMFDTKSKKLLELERLVLETAEYHFNDRCMVLAVTSEMQEKTGCSGPDLEGIAFISRSVEGVLAGVTLKQIDDNAYKVSLRTYPPLDASAICKTLGGGGHFGAAGAIVYGSLQEAKLKVLDAVKAYMEENDAGAYTNK
ncbi:MAG: DHH family phosphoesterase [Clostridia bacterium]|nr:DHH family phosphoesterase [Clostridia bacterium]MBP3706382.1 DHH family phosphoesterase [Clostridia bacterium]